jgi:hypothetical protein
MEYFQATGSHDEIGFSIGQRFSDEIRQAMAENPTLQHEFLPFHKSPKGKILFQQLNSLHRQLYPNYISEIKEYPIFRTAQPPDDIATLVTCVFDLNAKRLTIYYGHPIKEEEKCAKYSMQF